MADTKISAMTDGVPAQDGDLIAAAREISPGVYGNVSLTAASVAARAPAPTPVPSDFQAPIVDGYYYSGKNNSGSERPVYPDILGVYPVYFSQEKTWTKIGVEITGAVDGKMMRLGIYESGADNLPGALLLDAGEIDCSTTGEKEITIDQALNANTLYWLAVATDAAVNPPDDIVFAVMSAQSSTSPDIGQTWMLGSSTRQFSSEGMPLMKSFALGALPDPFGSAPDDSSSQMPFVWLRTGV